MGRTDRRGAGCIGGLLLRWPVSGWGSEELAGPSVLALALLAYLCATLIGANGFVAARGRKRIRRFRW